MAAERTGRSWASKWWERLHDSGPKRGAGLREWADLLVKCSAPAVVILGALFAHKFQESMTMATLLNQREQSDTQIRAEMFKAITDRLIGDKGDKLQPQRQAVFAELLALNFHEHIELKPLMQELDSGLSKKIAQAKTKQQRQSYELKLNELQSVARRVRVRQTALLYHPVQIKSEPRVAIASWVPWLGADIEGETGLLRMISVRFGGRKYGSAAAKETRCDVDEHPKHGEAGGRNVCAQEPIIEPAPGRRIALSIAVDHADWKRQAFTLSVKAVATEHPLDEADSPPLGDVEVCGDALGDSNPGAAVAATGGSAVSFETTWYDFPLTDNTQLADGSRYAVFIDDVCPEDKTVKLGLLWFPRDYFPARERPTNYHDLRARLKLDEGRH
jgi:hypothetical protein